MNRLKIWSQKFVRWYKNRKKLSEKFKVLEILEHIDKRPLSKRPFNVWDTRFQEVIPVVYKYGRACSLLNRFGNVCDTYFACLGYDDICLELQRKFCEVEYNKYSDRYSVKYPNLLCGYLKRWDLEEKIKQELFDNPKYQDVVECYKLFKKA